MKLRIIESDERKIYVDLIRGGTLENIHEDIVPANEPIKKSSLYSDKVDTRKNITTYLEPLATKIRKLPYIDVAYTHYSEDSNNKGLSTYVRIIFKHPYGISEDEISNYYYYTIRFSDHKHEEAEKYQDVLESFEVVGEKPSDFSDVGWEIFEDYAEDIKNFIKQHEIETYGYPKTTL